MVEAYPSVTVKAAPASSSTSSDTNNNSNAKANAVNPNVLRRSDLDISKLEIDTAWYFVVEFLDHVIPSNRFGFSTAGSNTKSAVD